MNPLAYAAFNALGLIAAFLVYRRTPARPYAGLQEREKTALYGGMVFGAILGAKLPVLLSYGWSLGLLCSGKSLLGALWGAYLGMNLAKRAHGLKGRFGDRFVPALCVAAAFGNVGCWFGGCCGGRPAEGPLAMRNMLGAMVYPTQLYTSFFQASMAWAFLRLRARGKGEGLHFPLYMIAYGCFRFLIEFLRTEPRAAFGLTVYQYLALGAAVFFGAVLRRRIREESPA
jgi:prolipoprotein diacylglyceryltransferase